MNTSIYVFGKFASGYTQSPDDPTRAIFQQFAQHALSPTSLCIHREGTLMYYGYIRFLDKTHYVGLCIVLTNQMVTRPAQLFLCFEKTIGAMATKGWVIRFDEKGNFEAHVKRLSSASDDVIAASHYLRSLTTTDLHGKTAQLPPVDFSIEKGIEKAFDIEDADGRDIVRASHLYSYTYIYKSRNVNTVTINTYKSVLARVNKENLSLKAENEKLRKAPRKAKSPTIWLRYCTFIIAILVFLIVVLIVQKSNMEIRLKSDAISKENTIGHNQPFIVKGLNYNFHEDKITIDYYGITPGLYKIDIDVRKFKSNRKDVHSCEIDIAKGDNQVTFQLNDAPAPLYNYGTYLIGLRMSNKESGFAFKIISFKKNQ